MTGRARARVGLGLRVGVVMDGKIINMALLIPACALYYGGPSFTRGALIYHLKGPGGPSLMGALIFYDNSLTREQT